MSSSSSSRARCPSVLNRSKSSEPCGDRPASLIARELEIVKLDTLDDVLLATVQQSLDEHG
mgnify:CR=1 FL=1